MFGTNMLVVVQTHETVCKLRSDQPSIVRHSFNRRNSVLLATAFWGDAIECCIMLPHPR